MIMQTDTNPVRIAEEIYQIKNYFTEDAFKLLYYDISLKILKCNNNENITYQNDEYQYYHVLNYKIFHSTL